MHRKPPALLPDPGDRTVPRYSHQPLPPYRYVPGLHPHPTRDPAGHSYGRRADRALRTGDLDDWVRLEPWCFGVDLFNRFYFWEAHEAWEDVWRVASAGSANRLLVQGLIQVAAALLTLHLDRPEAACRLADAGVGRIRDAGTVPSLLGMSPAAVAASFDAYFAPLHAHGAVVLGRAVPVLRLHGAPPR